MIFLDADVDPYLRMFQGALIGIVVGIVIYFRKRSLTRAERPRKKGLMSDAYDRISDISSIPKRDEYKLEKVVKAKYSQFLDAVKKYAPNAKPYFLELDVVQFKETLNNGLSDFGTIEYTIIDSYIIKTNSIADYKESKFAIEIKATLLPNVKLKATSNYFYDNNEMEIEFRELRRRLFESKKYRDALQLNRVK